MTSAEEHKKNIRQFMDDINEKIRAGTLLDRQKIIAFAASEAATNLLEYFLHKKELVSGGFRVNHRYFTSDKRAERYISFTFDKKKELIALMSIKEIVNTQLGEEL